MDLPGYDAWLEKPYQEMYARGDRLEAAAEARDIRVPNLPGQGCPKCGMAVALMVPEDPDCFGCGTEDEVAGCPLHFPELGTLWCDGCKDYVLRDEEMTWDPDSEDIEPPEPEYDPEPPAGWEP